MENESKPIDADRAVSERMAEIGRKGAASLTHEIRSKAGKLSWEARKRKIIADAQAKQDEALAAEPQPESEPQPEPEPEQRETNEQQ